MNAAPASAAEVARLIGEAGPAGVSCRRQPGCGHWHLDLSRLNQLRFYTPGDLTVGAEAGMTVAALNAALAPEGQFVPLDVAAPERATLGAVLAEHRS
ncbi:MAG: FAD-binding protein, partial [Terriglobales bacterium]